MEKDVLERICFVSFGNSRVSYVSRMSEGGER